MSLFSMLKSNSKRALQGNWGKAIWAVLIPAGVSLALALMQNTVINLFVEPFDFDPVFAIRHGFNNYFFHQYAKASAIEVGIISGFALLSMVLLAPLSLGLARWFYLLIQGQARPLSDLFRYFESGRRYLRALWLEINLRVRSFLWGIVFFAVPSAIFGGCIYVVTLGEEAGRVMQSMASAGLVLAAVLFLLAALFYGALLNKYLPAAYLLSEDDDLGVREAIRQSSAYTQGYRFSLLWYQLSFFGWVLLCAFVVPILYVGPYLSTAMAMYSRYLIEKGRFQPPEPTREFRPQQGNPEEREVPRPQPPVWPQFDDPAPVPHIPEPLPEPAEGPSSPPVEGSLQDLGDSFRFPDSRHPPVLEPEGDAPTPDALEEGEQEQS